MDSMIKKNCMTWNWKNWDRSGWQDDEKCCQKSEKLLKEQGNFYQVGR